MTLTGLHGLAFPLRQVVPVHAQYESADLGGVLFENEYRMGLRSICGAKNGRQSRIGLRVISIVTPVTKTGEGHLIESIPFIGPGTSERHVAGQTAYLVSLSISPSGTSGAACPTGLP